MPRTLERDSRKGRAWPGFNRRAKHALFCDSWLSGTPVRRTRGCSLSTFAQKAVGSRVIANNGSR